MTTMTPFPSLHLAPIATVVPSALNDTDVLIYHKSSSPSISSPI